VPVKQNITAVCWLMLMCKRIALVREDTWSTPERCGPSSKIIRLDGNHILNRFRRLIGGSALYICLVSMDSTILDLGLVTRQGKSPNHQRGGTLGRVVLVAPIGIFHSSFGGFQMHRVRNTQEETSRYLCYRPRKFGRGQPLNARAH